MKAKFIPLLAAACIAAQTAGATDVDITVEFPGTSRANITIPVIDNTRSVSDVKDTVARRTGIPVAQQQVTNDVNTILPDGTPLSSFCSNSCTMRVNIIRVPQKGSNFKLDTTSATYNGTPQAAVIDTAVAGKIPCQICTSVRYNGKTTPPTNAGTYAVTISTPQTELHHAADSLYVDTFRIAPFSIAAPATACVATITGAYAYKDSTPHMPATTQISVKCTLTPPSTTTTTLVRTRDYAAAYPTANRNAGRASIVISGAGNYIGNKTGYFNIDSITPTAKHLTYDLTPVAYNGAEQPIPPVIRPSGMGAVTIRYFNPASASNPTDTPKNAGKYQVWADVAGITSTPRNFRKKDSIPLGYYTILPRQMSDTNLNVIVKGAYAYNGVPQMPPADSVLVTYTVGSVIDTLINPRDYIYTAGNNVNAGDSAVISVAGAGNYAGIKRAVFAIDTADLAVTWDTAYFIYNGNPQKPAASATGLLGGIPLNVTGEQTDVGTYTATAAIATPDGNYRLTNFTKTFIIAPDTVQVQWDTLSFTYLPNTAQKPVPTANYGSAPVTFNVSILDSAQHIQTGTYRAAARPQPSNSNYVLRNDTVWFYILRSPIGVQWVDTSVSVYYNGSPRMPLVSIQLADGLIVSSPTAVNITLQSGTAQDAGIYKAWASYPLLNRNYILSGDTAYLTIRPKPIRVNWSDTLRVYNGTNLAPAATATGIAGNITIEVPDSGLNAGSYIAVAASPDPNYTLTDSAVTFRIVPHPVPVAWRDTILEYSGRVQMPFALATGLFLDTIPLFINGGQRDVGTGYIASAYAAANPNYILTDSAVIFHITPDTVPVIWDSLLFVYDALPHRPAARAKGIGSDVINLDITVAAPPAEDVGEYTATASIAAGGTSNYVLTGDSVRFAIYPATITVDWNDSVTFAYTGRDTAPSATLLGGSALPFVIGGSQRNAGTYRAFLHLSAPSANFALSNADTTFTITPIAASVLWGDTILEYSGRVQTPFASAAGIGEDIPITISGGQSNVGTGYTATAYSAANPNYILTDSAVTFRIVPDTVPVIWDSLLFVYDELLHRPAARAKGVGNDVIDLDIAVDAPAADAGEYTARASVVASGSPNYILTGDSVRFAIAPAVIEVDWNDNVTFAYTGRDTAPSATLRGAPSSITYTIEGKQRNAGTYRAVLRPSGLTANYVLIEADTTFTITPIAARTAWLNTNLTYNGREQKPEAGMVIPNDTVFYQLMGVEIIEGDGKEVGTHKARAVACSPNYRLNADSMVRTFNIGKKTTSITFAPSEYVGIEKGGYRLTASNCDNVSVRFRITDNTDGVIASPVNLINGDSIKFSKTGKIKVEAYIQDLNIKADSVVRTIIIVDGSAVDGSVSITNTDGSPIAAQDGIFRAGCIADRVVIRIPAGMEMRLLPPNTTAYKQDSIIYPLTTAGIKSISYEIRTIGISQTSIIDTLRIEKRFKFDEIITTKYDNTLLYVINGDNYKDFKWEKEGRAVCGNQPYCTETDGGQISGTYSLTLTDKENGGELNVCNGTLFAPPAAASASMRAYPNPVSKGGVVTLQNVAAPAGSVIWIYDVQGTPVGSGVVAGDGSAEVRLPAGTGTYFIVAGGETIKAVVQ